ncbi:uncharacterized protein LOC131659173 [Vicia villosa]|uniref:uncharacterized protein LOC131659173 n=1 Tax=Vicia villosa TaxID=3911 RepID=UPI00273CD07E|nr:uncharacterized protein LOC131659173 [Vicia villosa]
MAVREDIHYYQPLWDQMQVNSRFSMKKVYDRAMDVVVEVNWKHMIQKNYARPRAILYLCLSYHGRLATKARLKRFGFIHEDTCVQCKVKVETIDHLLFECSETNKIWKEVLGWLGINHQPQRWEHELEWIKSDTKNKISLAGILKICIAETIYEVWCYRNAVIFGNNSDSMSITKNIIDVISYRGWVHQKYRKG